MHLERFDSEYVTLTVSTVLVTVSTVLVTCSESVLSNTLITNQDAKL